MLRSIRSSFLGWIITSKFKMIKAFNAKSQSLQLHQLRRLPSIKESWSKNCKKKKPNQFKISKKWKKKCPEQKKSMKSNWIIRFCILGNCNIKLKKWRTDSCQKKRNWRSKIRRWLRKIKSKLISLKRKIIHWPSK